MKRIYKLQGTIIGASGLIGSSYKDSKIVATMTLEATETCLNTFKGQVVVSGVIVSATDKNGKDINISNFGSGTKLSPQTINITSRDIAYKIDNSKTTVTIGASFDNTGTNITLYNIKVAVKGWNSWLVNNVVITGSGILIQEIPDTITAPIDNQPITPTTPINTQKSDLSKPLKGVRIANGWSSQDPIKLATGYKMAGCNVLGFEVMEYITTGDLATAQKQQIDKLVPFKKACDSVGLWFELCTNTNDQLNPSNKTQTLLDRHIYAAQKLGKDIIVQPASETASSNIDWKKVRTEANKLFTYTSQYRNTGVSGTWTEVHPCSVGNGLGGQPAKPSTYVCTDCTPMMSDHMAEGALADFAKWVLNQNTSFSFYGTLPSLSTSLAQKAYGGSAGTIPEPTTPGKDVIDVSTATGWYKGGALSSLSKINITKSIKTATVDAKNIKFDSNPFSGMTMACLIWTENGKLIYTKAEWMRDGVSGVNWYKNVVPAPGICRDNKGVQHKPANIPEYAFILSEDGKSRTQVVKCIQG